MERGGEIFDFFKRAYEMVDDPSTDSVISWSQDGKSFIVWHKAECCRNLLPRRLGITNLFGFLSYGFRVKETRGGLVEVASDDFVRGRPELLDKASERYMEKFKKSRVDFELRRKTLRDRLAKCKNQEEKDLVFKERKEENEKRRREKMDKAFAMELDLLMKRIATERETREQQDLEDSILFA